MHGVRVAMSQTQSAGSVRTAHMSVMLWMRYTGWLKKVSCCTVSTAYFFEPPFRYNVVIMRQIRANISVLHLFQ